MIPVKTRDGRDAVVYVVLPPQNFPVQAFVIGGHGEDNWALDGSLYHNRENPLDLMLEGVDLSSVTIGPNGEMPEKSDADYLALCRERVKTRELKEELDRLKSQLNDVMELLDKERRFTDRLQKDRLERIATAAMQGLLASEYYHPISEKMLVEKSLEQAHALIEALDKEKVE